MAKCKVLNKQSSKKGRGDIRKPLPVTTDRENKELNRHLQWQRFVLNIHLWTSCAMTWWEPTTKSKHWRSGKMKQDYYYME